MKSDKLWVACGTCDKQISVKAKACPHCGAQLSRSSKWKWILGGVVVLTIVSAIAAPKKPNAVTADGTAQKASSTTSAKHPDTSPLPARQTNFIGTVADYKKRFGAASNELQESTLKDERGTALIGLLGPQLSVDGWIGTLQRLETNTEGKASVAIRLSPETSVLTWNNGLADMVHPTMIDKGTPIYKALMNMSVGDTVVVSGNFIASDDGGLLEGSLTIAGAMNSPEFLFRFNDVSKK